MIKIACEKTLYYSNDDEIMIKAIYNNENNHLWNLEPLIGFPKK